MELKKRNILIEPITEFDWISGMNFLLHFFPHEPYQFFLNDGDQQC